MRLHGPRHGVSYAGGLPVCPHVVQQTWSLIAQSLCISMRDEQEGTQQSMIMMSILITSAVSASYAV